MTRNRDPGETAKARLHNRFSTAAACLTELYKESKDAYEAGYRDALLYVHRYILLSSHLPRTSLSTTTTTTAAPSSSFAAATTGALVAVPHTHLCSSYQPSTSSSASSSSSAARATKTTHAIAAAPSHDSSSTHSSHTSQSTLHSTQLPDVSLAQFSPASLRHPASATYAQASALAPFCSTPALPAPDATVSSYKLVQFLTHTMWRRNAQVAKERGIVPARRRRTRLDRHTDSLVRRHDIPFVLNTQTYRRAINNDNTSVCNNNHSGHSNGTTRMGASCSSTLLPREWDAHCVPTLRRRVRRAVEQSDNGHDDDAVQLSLAGQEEQESSMGRARRQRGSHASSTRDLRRVESLTQNVGNDSLARMQQQQQQPQQRCQAHDDTCDRSSSNDSSDACSPSSNNDEDDIVSCMSSCGSHPCLGGEGSDRESDAPDCSLAVRSGERHELVCAQNGSHDGNLRPSRSSHIPRGNEQLRCSMDALNLYSSSV